MKKAGIVVLLFFLLISTGSPVQAKESRITLHKDFPPGYFAGTDSPLFANVELAQPVRRGPSAESCVSTLAHDERTGRKIGGGVLTGMGCVFILIGAQSKDNDSASGALIAGVILAGLGLYTLSVPGYVESEYNRILKIEDPLEREEMAYTVLTHIAHKAKVERISTAISSAVCCLYNLTYGSSFDANSSESFYYNALLCGALSVYYFMVESPAERMLREYQEGQKRNGSFRIIPRPDGSITAVYSLAL